MSEPTFIIRYDGFNLNGSVLPSTPVMSRRSSAKMKVKGRKNMEATRRMLREAGYSGISVVEKKSWF